MRRYFLLLLIFFATLASINAATAGETCSRRSLHEIETVFSKAIELNERLKKSIKITNGEDEQYRALRKENEKTAEEIILPCVERAAQLLSHGSYPTLMYQLMKLTVSYENSADETISFSMGKIFSENPSAVEAGIKSFSNCEKIAILNSVSVGWANIKSGLAPSLVKDRDKRIKRLLSSVGICATQSNRLS